MTEIQIPYLPSAQFFKIRCRLGINEQDIIGDSDSDPQIRTIGGTVTISASIPRFRYTEADGRKRVVYTKTETYNIQTSTGELFDADGNISVNLLNTNSPQMDPQGWTYKATVRPNGGEPFDVSIPSDGGGEVFDLGDGLVFTPSTGITTLEARVKALEDAQGGASGLPENFDESVQDIVGAMVAASGGSYNDADGTITLPSGGGSGLPVQHVTITGDITQTTTGWPTDQVVTVVYTQGGAGGHAVTFDGTDLQVPASGSSTYVFWLQGGVWVWGGPVPTGGSAPTGIEVTPAEPTFTDPSGTADDRYVIPTATGVVYSKGGTVIAAGTYTPTAGEAVTITAAADTGYTIASGATVSWSHTFSTVVANTAPSMNLGAPTVTDLDVSQPFTTSDSDGDTVTVTADWGDGTTPGTVASPATHTYAAGGTYDATFTPNDGTVNGVIRTATYTVAVSAIPPVGNPATFAAAVAAYGAEGWWKLDETTGTTITDYSGKGRHGTLSGTPDTDYTLAGQDGKLRFRTASGKVTIPDADVFTVGSFGLTIFACVHMVNSSGGGGNRRVVSKHETANQAEWHTTMNYLKCQGGTTRNTGTTWLGYAGSDVDLPSTNAWHAVVIGMPYPGGADYPELYYNNGTPLSVSTAANTGTYANRTSPVTIGGGFVGALSNIVIFPTKLTGAHIDKLTTLARAEGLIA